MLAGYLSSKLTNNHFRIELIRVGHCKARSMYNPVYTTTKEGLRKINSIRGKSKLVRLHYDIHKLHELIH